jgi:hypothetical protein
LSSWIGAGILGVLLAVIYLLLVVPSAFLLRLLGKNEAPNQWAGSEPTQWGAWKMKQTTSSAAPRTRLPLVFIVLSYFVRQRQYLLLPVVFVLVLLGVLFFFVSSSPLAPFIYTLF